MKICADALVRGAGIMEDYNDDTTGPQYAAQFCKLKAP